jgi:hypothetical protein
MTEMIARVTQAIFDEMEISDGLDLPVAQRYALAAIKAMRTPSKAMLDAVEAEEDRRGYIASAYESMDAEAAWPVMIDAALNDRGS